METGFDGVEIHGGNGCLPEQFLSSDINKRTDAYGGSPEKRCLFVFELMNEVAKTNGEQNLAIRLSPFGLFNQARGEQRIEIWTHLCEDLKKSHPTLSYVNFIEPELRGRKRVSFKAGGLKDVILDRFRETFGTTPFFSAGGFDDTNSWGVVEPGKYDALLFWSGSTAEGPPLTPYDPTRYYGPFEDNAFHYTDYPTADQQKAKI
ncbi:hypothetical protein N7451_012677 [Penicillium sp. IBT 35674x]|nr:hypothetical protein N7451_012677 [Penicillium sp. IBT 35674x]